MGSFDTGHPPPSTGSAPSASSRGSTTWGRCSLRPVRLRASLGDTLVRELRASGYPGYPQGGSPPSSYLGGLPLPGPDFHRRVQRYPRHADGATFVTLLDHGREGKSRRGDKNIARFEERMRDGRDIANLRETRTLRIARFETHRKPNEREVAPATLAPFPCVNQHTLVQPLADAEPRLIPQRVKQRPHLGEQGSAWPRSTRR